MTLLLPPAWAAHVYAIELQVGMRRSWVISEPRSQLPPITRRHALTTYPTGTLTLTLTRLGLAGTLHGCMCDLQDDGTAS